MKRKSDALKSEAIVIGETIRIYSKVLNEERTILVYLPDGYDKPQKYPVISHARGKGNMKKIHVRNKYL